MSTPHSCPPQTIHRRIAKNLRRPATDSNLSGSLFERGRSSSTSSSKYSVSSTPSVCSSATQSISSESSVYSSTFSTRTSFSSQSSTVSSCGGYALASSVTSTNYAPLRQQSRPPTSYTRSHITQSLPGTFYHPRDSASTPNVNRGHFQINTNHNKPLPPVIPSNRSSPSRSHRQTLTSSSRQQSLRVNTTSSPSIPTAPIKIVTTPGFPSDDHYPPPPPPKRRASSSRLRAVPRSPANIDFNKVWSTFVDKSLNTQEDLENLMREKSERSKGIPSPQFQNYHAIILPHPLTHHTHRVIFNADHDHLEEWQEWADLEDVVPNEELMTELFYRVAEALEKDYGWIREMPAPGSSTQYNMIRPPYPDPRRPQPANPHTTKTNGFLLPASPTTLFTFPRGRGHVWCKSIAHQFSHLKAHRHITMGLVFNSWMNNLDDVAANVDSLPPPIWFWLYAMQAAYPGIFIIREEAESAKVHQIIERGLPPFDVLANLESGPFFEALLGRDGFERTCEAAEDARQSTNKTVFMKGSVKTRKRAMSDARADLPVSSFRRACRVCVLGTRYFQAESVFIWIYVASRSRNRRIQASSIPSTKMPPSRQPTTVNPSLLLIPLQSTAIDQSTLICLRSHDVSFSALPFMSYLVCVRPQHPLHISLSPITKRPLDLRSWHHTPFRSLSTRPLLSGYLALLSPAFLLC
ncbi:hypothetical protein FRB94_008150 [Tulasnella sp. JGI-2019a]|nr:hypothetical protein FRB94_008150 [Tulasnella sp. JGI-2019a]